MTAVRGSADGRLIGPDTAHHPDCVPGASGAVSEVIQRGAFKGQVPPPPYFGVDADGEPAVAHLFHYEKPWKSACGVPMRLMASEAETELTTCPACSEVTREWSKRKP